MRFEELDPLLRERERMESMIGISMKEARQFAVKLAVSDDDKAARALGAVFDHLHPHVIMEAMNYTAQDVSACLPTEQEWKEAA